MMIGENALRLGFYETCGTLNDEAQTGDYPAARAAGCQPS
jgi:hypothetical protein